MFFYTFSHCLGFCLRKWACWFRRNAVFFLSLIWWLPVWLQSRFTNVASHHVIPFVVWHLVSLNWTALLLPLDEDQHSEIVWLILFDHELYKRWVSTAVHDEDMCFPTKHWVLSLISDICRNFFVSIRHISDQQVLFFLFNLLAIFAIKIPRLKDESIENSWPLGYSE